MDFVKFFPRRQAVFSRFFFFPSNTWVSSNHLLRQQQQTKQATRQAAWSGRTHEFVGCLSGVQILQAWCSGHQPNRHMSLDDFSVIYTVLNYSLIYTNAKFNAYTIHSDILVRFFWMKFWISSTWITPSVLFFLYLSNDLREGVHSLLPQGRRDWTPQRHIVSDLSSLNAVRVLFLPHTSQQKMYTRLHHHGRQKRLHSTHYTYWSKILLYTSITCLLRLVHLPRRRRRERAIIHPQIKTV